MRIVTKHKNLIIACAFVLTVILGLTTLTYMIRTNGDTKTRFMGFYAEQKNSLDVVMIGSSPTYSSCIPAMLYGEYGIKAYPLASNVQRPIAGMYLTKEALKTQSPKMFLYEMRMYVGIDEGLTSHMAYTRDVVDNMKYSYNRIDTINAMIKTGYAQYNADPAYTYYFDIFKYHSNWKTLIMPEQLGAWRYTRLDPNKGYTITDKVGPAEKPVIDETIEPAELDKFQERALQGLLDYLKENNIQALFYVSPYTLAEGDDARFAQIKNEVTEAGFDYLDMNQYYDEIGIDFARDFSDYGIHTNAVGAKKCTEFLGEYLRTNYELPDHRIHTGNTVKKADKKSTSWLQAYENWKQEYDEAEAVIEERIKNEDWAVLDVD